MVTPVSLAIPNYNGQPFLETTLRALLAQDYPDFEVILVDNCSTDDSLEMAYSLKDPRLVIVEADEHVTIMENFNRAKAQAKRPFFALCTSDELYEPHWLSGLVGLLEAHPEAFCACCKTDSVDSEGRIYLAPEERYKDLLWPAGEPVLWSPKEGFVALLRGNLLVLPTTLFRKSATDVIGDLSPAYTFVGDWDYWFRGVLEGFSIVGTHRRLGHYRRHPGMMTQKLSGTFVRYEQEMELIRVATSRGYAEGFWPTAKPDYHLVRKIILSRFATLLARGEKGQATELASYAREHVPGMRLSGEYVLMKLLHRSGAWGGKALQLFREGYLRLLTRVQTTNKSGIFR